MEMTLLKIEDIIPYENNARVNDHTVHKLAESIKEYGYNVPITVDEDNVIVTGHTRLKALISLGNKHWLYCKG